MSYLIMVSHGKGRRYVQGPEVVSLMVAERIAKEQARYLNERKQPRAPKVTVTVLRKVGEYNG